jgi:hypothetical protein
MKLTTLSLVLILSVAEAFVPFIDGGKGIPKLYDGYFNEQIAKQASTAVSKAISAGKVRLNGYSVRSTIHCAKSFGNLFSHHFTCSCFLILIIHSKCWLVGWFGLLVYYLLMIKKEKNRSEFSTCA